MDRTILCIDLKSFFAAAECVDKGLDPYTTPLVVANPHQGNGAITLAITPFLKSQGIKSRCRLYEIPKYVKYTIVPPRMKLYKEYSDKVVNVYLKFVAKEDMHIYSIDECFLDLTNYLKLYKKTDLELANDILNTIYKETGLTATCGIGPNVFMAKVAMDTDAKKYKNGITKWTYDDIKDKLWSINKLSFIWGIGKSMEKKLNNLGIYTVYDLANYDKNKLNLKIGSFANEMIDQLNGIDKRDIKSMNSSPKDKSYSVSNALLFDHNENNIKPIIMNMAAGLSEKLHKNNKEAYSVNFRISYSKDFGGYINKTVYFEKGVSDKNDIYNACILIFENNYEMLPIRKVEIHLFKISELKAKQLNLFENIDNAEKSEKINDVVLNIKNKYGDKIIKNASSLINK